MKVFTPEIAWNSKEPIYAIDFQPSEVSPGVFRFATGGTDKEIKVWWITNGTDTGHPEFRSALKGHQGTVNTIRFSPDGKLIASGDVDGLIVLWRLSATSSAPDIFGDEDVVENKEKWEVFKRLRSHLEDVSDLAWSKDSKKLLSASVDKSVIVWDATKGVHLKILKNHKHYVVGLAWDPVGRFCVSVGQDRSFIVYNTNSFQRTACVTKAEIPDFLRPESTNSVSTKLFHDDTMMSFARRPEFSPDGELLFVPAGCIESGVDSINTSYIFCRQSWEKPVLILPSPEKPTIAVRCCPVMFALQDGPNTFRLPHRIVFAVLSFDSVILYDTQHLSPIAFVGNIHYANLTDLAWSDDGRFLVVSSIDAFCTIIAFDENEFGIPIKTSNRSPSLTDVEEMEASHPVSLKDEVAHLLSSPKAVPLPTQTESLCYSAASSGKVPASVNTEIKVPPIQLTTHLPEATPQATSVSAASPQQSCSLGTKPIRRIELVTLSRSPQTTPGQAPVRFGCRKDLSMPSLVATESVAAVEPQIFKSVETGVQSAITVDAASPEKKKLPKRVALITLD